MKNGVINNRFLIVLIIVGIAGAAWAQELPTLTLTSAVETALDLNREMAAVRFEKNAAHLAKMEAYSPFLPQISFQSDFSNSHSDQFEFKPSPDMPAEFADLFNFSDMGFTGETYANKFQFGQLIFDRSIIGNLKLSRFQEEAAQYQEMGSRTSGRIEHGRRVSRCLDGAGTSWSPETAVETG